VVVVGVTGGIGCGKSTVATLLAARGAVVVDADQMARQVVAPGGPSYQAVIDHFGPGVVAAGGALDRAALAARVFSHPEELAVLDAITHPAIAAALVARLTALAQAGDDGLLVVLDIPLLTEAAKGRYGLAGVVVVDAPIDVAVRRLVDQRGLTETDAKARIGAQPSREQRRQLGDVVVDNSGGRQELEAAVDRVWTWILSLAAARSPAPSVDGPAQEAPDADGHEDHQEQH
jgi:dephospho-CoA kinase